MNATSPAALGMTFPSESGGTQLVVHIDGARLPVVGWVGRLPDRSRGVQALLGAHRGAPLLLEHSRGSFGRPGLRAHRLSSSAGVGDRDIAGRDWSTAFTATASRVDGDRLVIDAGDAVAGLSLRTEVQTLPGGALRARHHLTNLGTAPYLVEGLEVTVPLPDSFVDLLDFTGRHERERVPQRHAITDGLWAQESRTGKPGLDSASLLIAGTAGFGFDHGELIALAVATSGNSIMTLQRSGAAGSILGGGELLLPGEVVLTEGETYATPWVFIVAADDGLDSISAALHTWQRSLDSHPAQQPVTLNVWEAVYFDHDLGKLTAIADLAAQVGVERFVLDDGWFRGRRDDHAGLGDWWVDDDVWPGGLDPLIKHVKALGMQFGLWFEPEMVNPDSELYRAHPDWILSTGDRIPLLHRNQLVLDLTHPDVWAYLCTRLDEVLTNNAIDYVKWDHNRDLLDAGSNAHGGAPAIHRQTLAYYRLLDELRARHPGVDFESCAAGGGRIDLAVLERVQRVWTSDMTDALSRQQIQRWTAQFVAPEYLGAHVSSPTSHQTGRALTLDFRAATALFGSFGIEWDITQASPDELNRLAEWVHRYQDLRPLLHSGRMIRIETNDPAVLAHGVVASDRRRALVAHVQLDESTHNRGVVLRVPRLDPALDYGCSWVGPLDSTRMSVATGLDPAGPTGGEPVSGAVLERIGLWLPRRRPESAVLIELAAR